MKERNDMKKLIALLLAVLLLAGAACAEEAVQVTKTAANMQTVESVTGLVTFDVPSRWFVMKPGMIDELFELIGDDALASAGLDEQAIAYAKAAMSQVDLSQMDMVFTASMTGNLNLVAQDASGVTMELIKLLKTAYDQAFISQYAALGAAEDSIVCYDIEQIGDLEWYRLDAEVMGSEISQFMTCDDNGHLILFTFTNMAEPDFLPVLESVKLI